MFNSTSETQQHGTEEGFSTDSTSARAPRLSNETLAVGLESIASLLADDSRERVRREALRRAAGLIRSSRGGALALAIDESGIEAVHALGINYELSGIVTDWVRLGRLHWLEQLQSRRRAELAHVPGIGPRLAEELREVLGVVDLDGLAEVVRDGRLMNVCGFGPKRVKLVARVLAGRAARPAKETSGQLMLPSYA